MKTEEMTCRACGMPAYDGQPVGYITDRLSGTILVHKACADELFPGARWTRA